MGFGSVRLLLQCSRKFSCSGSLRCLDAQGKFMAKLLSNKLERKLQGSKSVRQSVQMMDKRRIAVLNKMYMQNISQALAFGGFEEISDKGIQVTRVAVKNSSYVEVFWISSNNENPQKIQTYLDSIAGKVANQLMYANIGGFVPVISFKRDLSADLVYQTEALLELISVENREYEETMKMRKISEEEDTKKLEEVDVEPPPMRMDIFGFRYDKVLRRIQDCKKKSYPLHIPNPPTSEELAESLLRTSSCQTGPENTTPLKDRKKELRKFISLYQKSALSKRSQMRNEKIAENYNHEFDEEEENNDYDSQLTDFDDNWIEENTK